MKRRARRYHFRSSTFSAKASIRHRKRQQRCARCGSPNQERTNFLVELLETVRQAALDKKAEDVQTIDLVGKSILADTFVIATGRSKIQTRSIADAIALSLREHGFGAARIEGYADGGWILLDAGSVIVHVFTPDERRFYNLERLWGSAPLRLAQGS